MCGQRVQLTTQRRKIGAVLSADDQDETAQPDEQVSAHAQDADQFGAHSGNLATGPY